MNTNPPRDFQIWLAGFWDGDGNFQISPNTQRRPYGQRTYRYYQLSVSISNTCKPVLEYIQQVLAAGNLFKFTDYPSQRSPKRRTTWKLHFSSAEARAVAHLLAPYLHIKREQAMIIANWPLLSRNGQWKDGRQGRDMAGLERQAALHRRIKELHSVEYLA